MADEIEQAEEEISLQDELRAVAAEMREDDRPRDEHGRFAPRAEEKPAEQAAEPVEKAPEAEEIELPKHWSAEERERWTKIPPEHRAALLDARKSLEAGYDEKFKTVAEERKQFARYQEIDRYLEPHRGRMRQIGVGEGEFISRLLNAEAALHGPQKVETFRALAQTYGIDLGALAGQQTEAPSMMDPVAAQRIAELEARIHQLTGGLQGIYSSQAQTVQQTQQQQIAQFTDATDDKGQKLHPHVDRVLDEMIPIFSAKLSAGIPLDKALSEAYERATWAHPEVRGEMIAAETARRAADAKAKQEVEKAKTAGFNPRSKPLTRTPERESRGSFAEDLRAELAAARG